MSLLLYTRKLSLWKAATASASKVASALAATKAVGRPWATSCAKLGPDSAPHAAQLKEQSVCGAGCYTALSAIELYAEAFDAVDALDRLEAFASFNGPAFYGLPRNHGTVTLRREAWTLPESLPFGDAQLKPLRGGESLAWRLTGVPA